MRTIHNGGIIMFWIYLMLALDVLAIIGSAMYKYADEIEMLVSELYEWLEQRKA